MFLVPDGKRTCRFPIRGKGLVLDYSLQVVLSLRQGRTVEKTQKAKDHNYNAPFCLWFFKPGSYFNIFTAAGSLVPRPGRSTWLKELMNGLLANPVGLRQTDLLSRSTFICNKIYCF